MKFLYRFSVKTSGLFLLLLLTMGIAQAVLTIRISETRQVELDQLVNWDLAAEMARELEPIHDEISSAIHYMMVLNPTIEVYILNPEGKILAYFMESGSLERERVDTRPLEAFITMERKAPILGDDPRNRDTMKPFSVARATFSDSSRGYLYIILRSSLYDQAEMALGEKVLVGAIIGSSLISLAGVGLVGLLLFARLTRRLSLLTAGVQALEAGDFATPVLPDGMDHGNDEIGELAETFTTMARAIRRNLEELRAADRLHRELAANISHDLRSPLTSIQGYLETLQMKLAGGTEAENRRYVEIIIGESKKLSTLIDDLFQLSLLEADRVELNIEQFSLTELLQDELVVYSARAVEQNILIENKLPRELLPVQGDLKLIRRALTNLLDNAIKFTPPGGRIRVSATATASGVRVSVSDNGPGIAAEELTRVFDRFYRGTTDLEGTDGSGSGLGLAIAHRIIELHGGSLAVESEEGHGSRFIIELKKLG